MCDFDDDEEPRTIRIKSRQPGGASYDGIPDPDTGIGLVATPTSTLNAEEIFKGLKSMLPFFLGLDLSREQSQGLKMLVSDEPPPALATIAERTGRSEPRGVPLRASSIPFCTLLGEYRPATTTVVVYEKGIDTVSSTFERDLKASIPVQLPGRPVRSLYIPDQEQMDRAFRTYLRWLLRTLTIIHELGHALVHLASVVEMPWRTPASFERLPNEVDEHLAQSFVATALEVREIAAPFPPSDLASVFSRLSLNLEPCCRAWAFSLPWPAKEKVSTTLAALRTGQLPPDLANLERR